MAKTLTWALGGLLLALLLAAGAAVVVVLFVDPNVVKPYVEAAASDALDRKVTIESMRIEPGPTTVVQLKGLRVANPDWASQDYLGTADELHVGVRIWPLLWGQIDLTEVVANVPTVHLERNSKGETTWKLGPVAEASGELAAPEARQEFPMIGRLRVEGGRLSYRDAVRGLALEGKIATAKGEAEGEDRVELSLEGTLEQRPLAIDFSGGSFTALRETERPFPVDFDVTYGDTKLTVNGTMTEPLQLRGFEFDLSLNGPTLAQLFPLLGIPLPDTRAYRLSGRLTREEDLWRVIGLDGKVGDSDLAGDVVLDNDAEPTFLEADLVSQTLNFEDLAGFIGAEAGDSKADEEAADGSSVFAQGSVAEKRLKAMNMDIRFNGKRVIARSIPVDDLSARLQLVDGRVQVRPLQMTIARGSLSGELALNVRDETPSADADLKFEELDLKPFFEETQFVQETGGRFSGHLYLLGVGKNLKEMMASAQGQGWIGMRDGAISGLLVEAAGLDVVEALALAVGDDARVRIRCGRLDFVAASGILTVQRAIVDTNDSVLLAQGDIKLGSESLTLQIEARPKDFSLIDMAAPVRLSGSFKDPSFSIGGLDPLPFLELGQADDLDCARLLTGKLSPAEVEEDE